MHTLEFTVSSQVLAWTNPYRVPVEQTRGYLFARFAWDDEWDKLSRTAVFRVNASQPVMVPLGDSDTVQIPPECLVRGQLAVGLIGLDQGGAVRLVTRQMQRGVPLAPSAPVDGEPPEDITLEAWEQALGSIGNLADLETSAKNTLVAAINEVKNTGGGGGLSASVSGETLILSGSSATVVGETLYLTSAPGTTTYGELVVSTDALRLTEGGEGSFTIFLDSAPSAEQLVALTVSDPAKVSVSHPTLKFNASNYSVPQIINVASLHDDDDVDDTITIAISSEQVEQKIVTVSIQDEKAKIATDGLILYADYRDWDGTTEYISDRVSGVKIRLQSGFIEKEVNGIRRNDTNTAYTNLALTRFDDAYTAFAEAWNSGTGLTLELFGNAIQSPSFGCGPRNVGDNYIPIGSVATGFVDGADFEVDARMLYATADSFETIRTSAVKFDRSIPYRESFIHAVATCSEDGTIALYLNGKQCATSTPENFISWAKLSLASSDDSAIIRYLTCLSQMGNYESVFTRPGRWITSQRIYNRALSAAEIEGNMTAEAATLQLHTFEIRPDSAQLEPGDTLGVAVKSSPMFYELEDLKYQSSDEQTVAVTGNTMVAEASGSASVTASATYNGRPYEASLGADVSQLAYDLTSARTATGITLARYPEHLSVGEEYSAQAYLISEITDDHPYPYGYPDDNLVVFGSSNPDICRVKNGVLLGVSPGAAIITVSDLTGSVTTSFQVSVSEPEIPEYSDSNTLVVNAADYNWSTSETTTAAIQDILSEASAAGIKKVIFPQQTYYVSPVYGSIYIPSQMTVDFSGGIIQIEASTMTTKGYTMIYLKDAVDTTLINATIYGERYLIEGTGSGRCMSLEICGASVSSGLCNCTVSRSPGFSTGFGNTNRKVSGVKLSGITAGGLDESGNEIDEPHAFRSDFTNISGVGNARGKIWLGNVQGYGGYLYMSARVYDVWFFDADKNLISVARSCIQYYAVDKPADAAYARIVFWQAAAPTKSDPDFASIAHFHSYDKPERCFIKNCTLEDNYSLAITPNGGENMLIDGCTFRRNGYRDPASHLDWEDGRQHNKGHIVRDNTFEEGGTAIMSVNSDGLVVHNNVFKGTGITLGSETQNARIWLNQLFNATVKIDPKTDEVFSQNFGYESSTQKIAGVENVSFAVRMINNTFE